ncbi:Putative disease resistance RPP13-like protein 1 [Glycine soja]|nr:Putative disease resistance RPP13-like protein 1 [Glycine soja]
MALELVGGALLSAFLQVAFEKLASPQVLDFFHGKKLDETLLRKLKIKLQSIDALADDAERKQFADPRVRNWLLETCTGCTCKVPNFFKSSPASFFNREIKSRMEKILDSLEFLSSQKDDLGLKNASGVGVGSELGSEVPQISQSTSLVVESDIYGRDKDKKMIFDWLTSDNGNPNQPSILSIVGMGGMGKTTLAQHVFNDPRIQETKFAVKAWVCVSDDFDAFRVTRTILEAITKSTDDSRDLEMVHGRLKEKLTGKRFLLVLDDVWNENRLKWEAVLKHLVFGAQGSRIIATTRSKEVASTMRSREHLLEQLQEDHCWKLFAKHAFQDDNIQPNPDCKEIGTKIVEKCKGLPLALKTMGSLLHNKSSVREWESILQSEIWEFSTECSGIVPALALSYHHLPSHLKRCFAYCALFPKDYEFDKECLIQLWMAENFLQCPQQGKSPEEVAEQYFNDLLSRSDDDQAKDTPKATRHFSVAINHIRDFDGFGTLCDTKKLRTYMPTSGRMKPDSRYRWQSWHCNLKYLRSLDLSNTEIVKLPESICSLYNLQILKLNCCGSLKELPSNLHKLTDLHRLELTYSGVRKVPAHLGKLKYLQVLMSPFKVGKSREFSIQQLGELNLHGSLLIQNLQNVENPSDAIAVDLKNKTHLVEVELEWDSDWNPDDSTKERDEIVIENLQPSKHLEKLRMRNYGGKQFPRWLLNNSLLNVVSLTLENCQSCQRLPPLGLLPFLKELLIERLDGIVSINADFFGSSSCSFTSLESLKFFDMKEWEEWECKGVTGAFPRLQRLSIEDCPKLKGHLPEQLCHLNYLKISGWDSLTTIPLDMFPILKELDLWKCPNLQRISQGQAHNHLQTLNVIECPQLESLPEGMHVLLPSLHHLVIYDCPKVEMFPEGGLPSNLKEMGLHGSYKLIYLLKSALGGNHSLETLDIGRVDVECLPEEGVLPHSLVNLWIRECGDLKRLDYKGLCHLSSLKTLLLWDCPRLQCLPEEGLPKSISTLNIRRCRLLKQRCREPEGEDWPKIAHIEDVYCE